MIVKGILHPDEAEQAIDAGASAIVVSNHGGRQIGGTITSVRALPGIARRVAGRVPLLVDSGISDEDDIFRAVALGADAALIGRPVVRALWERGEDGPVELIAGLRDAFENLLRLAGYADIAALRAEGADALAYDDRAAPAPETAPWR